MFPPFSGFEEFSIRVEIEWQGRVRPIEIRIEQLPAQPVQAVPICSFVDAPQWGEWLLVSGDYDIYTLGNPYNLLRNRPLCCGNSLDKENGTLLNPKRIEKLRETIERAVGTDNGGIRVLRVAQLSDVPTSPRIAIVSERGGFWLQDWKSTTATRFDTPDFDLYEHGAYLEKWVQTQWNNPESEVHFAWQWANWSDEERILRSFGEATFPLQIKDELEKVMRWVLLSSVSLWSDHYGWAWQLNGLKDKGELKSIIYWKHRDIIYREYRNDLLSWQKWLWGHFFPRWCDDWVEHYLCVSGFWEFSKHHSASEVGVYEPNPPTMHEQLEARLQLREWLADKASPDEIERLLGGLEP